MVLGSRAAANRERDLGAAVLVLAGGAGMSTNSDTALVAVEEIHAFVCGCERPGDADNGCVAEPPFAFRVLTGEEIGRVYTQRVQG